MPGKPAMKLRRRRPCGHRVAVSRLKTPVGEWYWIGVAVGLGAGVGVLFAGVLGADRRQLAAAVVLAAAAGAGVGFGLDDWDEAIGGGAGGVAGAIGAGELALGTLRRGGTRAGTAVLFAVGALAVAALGFAPALGYVEAGLLPFLGLRLRRRAGERHAGLRILARD
jgi:hypothetical protein